MTAQAEACRTCGAELVLFQPTCPRCETAHEWEFQAPCHDCGEQVAYECACPHCEAELPVWCALEADVLGRDEPKKRVPRPLTAGYRVHLGTVHGQWVNYRRSLGESEMHVRSYPRRYELHHDEVSALDSPGRHLLRHGLPAVVASGAELGTKAGKGVARSGRLVRQALRSPYAWLRTDRSDKGSGRNIE